MQILHLVEMQKLHAGSLNENFSSWPAGKSYILAYRQKMHTGLKEIIAFRLDSGEGIE